MTYISQLVVLLPLVISVPPTIPEAETRERQDLLSGIERDGLPLGAIIDSPEIQIKTGLVGTWQASLFEHSGQLRPDIAARLQMKFTRGRLELMQLGRPTIMVAYNVTPERTPGGFVWRLPDGGLTFQDGVYYLEGDKLVICLAKVNSPGASQFVTQPGDGKSLFVMRRISE